MKYFLIWVLSHNAVPLKVIWFTNWDRFIKKLFSKSVSVGEPDFCEAPLVGPSKLLYTFGASSVRVLREILTCIYLLFIASFREPLTVHGVKIIVKICATLTTKPVPSDLPEPQTDTNTIRWTFSNTPSTEVANSMLTEINQVSTMITLEGNFNYYSTPTLISTFNFFVERLKFNFSNFLLPKKFIFL